MKEPNNHVDLLWINLMLNSNSHNLNQELIKKAYNNSYIPTGNCYSLLSLTNNILRDQSIMHLLERLIPYFLISYSNNILFYNINKTKKINCYKIGTIIKYNKINKKKDIYFSNIRLKYIYLNLKFVYCNDNMINKINSINIIKYNQLKNKNNNYNIIEKDNLGDILYDILKNKISNTIVVNDNNDFNQINFNINYLKKIFNANYKYELVFENNRVYDKNRLNKFNFINKNFTNIHNFLKLLIEINKTNKNLSNIKILNLKLKSNIYNNQDLKSYFYKDEEYADYYKTIYNLIIGDHDKTLKIDIKKQNYIINLLMNHNNYKHLDITFKSIDKFNDFKQIYNNLII